MSSEGMVIVMLMMLFLSLSFVEVSFAIHEPCLFLQTHSTVITPGLLTES